MKCPACDGPTKVVDSRKKPEYLYRRRVCRACGTRFSTREVAFNIVVNQENQKEIARLQELTSLIDKQVKDARRTRIQYGASLNRVDEEMERRVTYDE